MSSDPSEFPSFLTNTPILNRLATLSASLPVYYTYRRSQHNKLVIYSTDHQLTKMFTMRAIIITILSAFLLLDGVLGSFLNVRNKCGFPVYCSAARSDPPSGVVHPQENLASIGLADPFKELSLPSTRFLPEQPGNPLWRRSR